MKTVLCPCGSNKSYVICCGRYHKGKLAAPSAEALMRSRYSAYVLKNAQYIYRTWDKTTRPPIHSLRAENSQCFTQLEILNAPAIKPEDECATVEFIASYTVDGKDKIHQHHENSYFVKRNNKWFYVNQIDKVDLTKSE